MPASERYRLVDMLGRGAMGEVWRAEDTALQREVAVKLLLEQPAEAEATERFRREAQTAARLNHANVVAVYDFDEEDGRLYLVMELVSGSSLREETAARGPLGIAEACRIAGQAATGLAAAHELGVVHRDIKPGNLLLSADGVVKVADFGIARAAMETASSLTTTGSMLGTTAYLAPERGSGSTAEPPSDVYALGCVLYEMLCGQPPFSGDPAAVVYQHINAAPPPPADLRPEQPDALADFILRMLAKDPTQRPTAAQAGSFLTRLAADADRAAGTMAAADAPAEPPAQSTVKLHHPARGHRRSRRRPTLVPAMAATVAVFLTAGAVGYQLNSGPEKGDAQPPVPSKSTSPEPGRSPAQHDSKAPATPPPARDQPTPSKTAEQLDSQTPTPTPTATQQDRKRRKEAAQKAIEDARKAAEERLKRREEAGKH